MKLWGIKEKEKEYGGRLVFIIIIVWEVSSKVGENIMLSPFLPFFPPILLILLDGLTPET